MQEGTYYTFPDSFSSYEPGVVSNRGSSCLVGAYSGTNCQNSVVAARRFYANQENGRLQSYNKITGTVAYSLDFGCDH